MSQLSHSVGVVPLVMLEVVCGRCEENEERAQRSF